MDNVSNAKKFYDEYLSEVKKSLRSEVKGILHFRKI